MEENLPYTLPRTTNEQLKTLSRITSIPSNLLMNAGHLEVEAISSMVLYRHMNRLQRIEAMRLIRSVPSRALMGKIISKTLDTTYVNPQWGIWSLSNEELKKDIALHSTIDSFAGYIGVGASALSGKDLVKDLLSLKRMGKKHWVTVVIWGCIYFNKSELNKARDELDNRTTLQSSGMFK
ncbi:hypothetical protein QWZ04_18140 [Vibrio tapetis subsp. quintayensis]|uniref:hypothetical protein n=1 Tax=Vibrio tapetis TaxID=52443 RepID=UPI0025B4434A|nr:hypothetical protein [Vibrio tapetis]MDN3682225.1 hypothetical protein [Vibrio tapetis subsp. quintayensis]